MTQEIQKWSDVAMFEAVPLTGEGERLTEPRVTVIDMTNNPLRKMAAVSELYRGGIYHNPNEITKAQALEWLDSARKSKISLPLEFITVSLFIEGIGRDITHQMVRQRTAAFIQESMRFAVKSNAEWEVPEPPELHGLPEDHPWRIEWDRTVRETAAAYNRLVNAGMPAESARKLLPTGIGTRIHWHTDYRNFIAQSGNRLCSQAQYDWKVLWRHIAKAITEYGPLTERWQQKALVSMLKPICFATGKCEFMGPADRWCVIRDRVEVHHKEGDLPEDWADINPMEPLSPDAARRSHNV
jgi:flavin-dependent thymidylate synthase